MERSGTLSLTLRRMVETMLSVHFDARVRIAGVQDFPYSTVSRCTLDAGGSTVPQTVVVRLLRKDAARSQPTRLHNEQAALEFLSSIGSTLAPRFIVGDASAGILIGMCDRNRHSHSEPVWSERRAVPISKPAFPSGRSEFGGRYNAITTSMASSEVLSLSAILRRRHNGHERQSPRCIPG